MRYLILVLLLAGCTAQEAADFNAATQSLNYGAQSWRRPYYQQQMPVTILGPRGQLTTCTPVGYGTWSCF